ncbi:MAG: SPL family radical SAM protein [Armatimonadota bacterium]
MVAVIPTQRKSAVLAPSSLACLADVATINLTLGCAHACLYCYARGYSTYPGDGQVMLYANTFEKLRQELSRKRKRPHAVYFSPSCDLFQPVPHVLELGYQVLEYLLQEGIGVAFLTKGVIPPEHFDLLGRHASYVRAQIGVTTLDADIAACFEPYAAHPAVRVAQIKQLIAAGIETHARLDPILPGVTDDESTLETLFAELARHGVKQSAASVLFLRPAIMHILKRELQDTRYLDVLLQQFSQCGRLGIHAERSTVTALPQTKREEVYTKVRSIAERYDITVRICACKNPDIATGSCRIAGQWENTYLENEQPVLF